MQRGVRGERDKGWKIWGEQDRRGEGGREEERTREMKEREWKVKETLRKGGNKKAMRV